MALDAHVLLGSWMSCICHNRNDASACARLTGRPQCPRSSIFFLEIRPSQIFTIFLRGILKGLYPCGSLALFSKFFGHQLKFMRKIDKSGYPVNVTWLVQIPNSNLQFHLTIFTVVSNLSKAARTLSSEAAFPLKIWTVTCYPKCHSKMGTNRPSLETFGTRAFWNWPAEAIIVWKVCSILVGLSVPARLGLNSNFPSSIFISKLDSCFFKLFFETIEDH